MTRPRRMLIYCPLPESGFAEHTHYQAGALCKAGVEALVLTSPGFLPDHAGKPYKVLPWLLPPFAKTGSRLVKGLYFALATVLNEFIFAFRILFWGHRHVLIAGSSEMLALIWVWPHVILSRLGVRYAVNIHDPQRKRSGSALHDVALKASFLPIEFGLVHDDFDREQPDIPRHVGCLPVPYGCYEAQVADGDGADLRPQWLDGHAGRKVFLAFGYIADRKNVDLCIRAVADLPDAVLVVAGRLASNRDKPVAYYRELAQTLGCPDRVFIYDGFIPETEVRQYFGACDFVLLTYKAEFVSQSGVLLLASNWRKPVLASSGPGPLSRNVRRFDLGPAVAPDDVAVLCAAMAGLMDHGHSAAGWAAFCEHASWKRNIDVLLEALAGAPRGKISSNRT